jgi:hypothetical protein
MSNETTRPTAGRLNALRLENIGRFDALTLTFGDGAAVSLIGGNDEGKSTVLDALAAAITGRLTARTQTRLGAATDGTIWTRIGDVEIRKVIRDGKGVSLEVRDASGQKWGQPQTLLNGLFGGTFLNPFDLMSATPKERAKLVATAMPIDASAAAYELEKITGRAVTINDVADVFPTIARLHQGLYDDRREQGAAVRAAEASLTGAREQLLATPVVSDLPPKPAPVAEVAQALTATQGRNARREAENKRLETLRADIDEAERNIAIMREAARGAGRWLDELGPTEDTSALERQLASADEAREAYAAAQQRQAERDNLTARVETLAGELEEERARHARLDKQVTRLAALPAELLGAAELPIPGMVVSGENIYLPDGDALVPLEAMGEAHQLDFCVRVAMAVAPASFLLVDGMERCDATSRARIVEAVAAAGFQVVATRVTDGPLAVEGGTLTLGGE